MADKCLLTPLPSSTIRLIGSSQVITSVYSVVKELLENCFDAHATAVDVKLENYGLDKIEIKDNGDGIRSDDVQYVGQRHYTSKITSHDDLQHLQTYGFRGEALASLCSVSEVSITTKTEQDEISVQYKLNSEGKIKDSLPSHLGQGTTICAINLFKNLPVRKQYHNTNKKKKVELKKIEDLLRVYSIIKPNVRITLRHNKELVFQKNSQPDTRAAILNVFGHQTANLLVFSEKSDLETMIKLEMFLPKPGGDLTLTSRASSERGIISVNNRPVSIPDLDKVVRQYYSNCNGCDTTRYPVYYLSITLPSDRQDVNLDPNKTHVYLQDMDVCKKLLTELLEYNYGPLDSLPYWKKQTEGNKSVESIEMGNVSAQNQLVQFERSSEKLDENSNQSSKANEVPINRHARLEDKSDAGDSADLQNESSTSEAVTINKHARSGDESKDTTSRVNSIVNENDYKLAQGNEETDNHSEENVSLQNGNSNRLVVTSEMDTSAAFLKHVSNTPALKQPTSEDSLLEFSDSFDESVFQNEINMQGTNFRHVSYDEEGKKDNSLATEPSLDVGRFDITDDLLDEILPTQTPPIAADNTNQQSKSFLTSNQFSRPTSTNENTEDTEVANDMTGLKDINDDDWTRGIACGVSGKVIQPVTLLPPGSHNTPGKRPLSPSTSKLLQPAEKKPRPVMNRSITVGQTTMYDIVGNQTIKRATVSTKTVQSGSIGERLLSSVKRVKKYRPGVKIVDVPFSTSKLCEKYKSGFLLSQSQPSSSIKVSGRLKSNGMWICTKGLEIFLTNPHRLTEVVLFHRLMQDYKCTTRPLDTTITLNASNLGEDNWEKLKGLALLDKSTTQYTIINHKAILYNGFNIKSYHNSETGEWSLELLELANCIPTYNLKDLIEILTSLNIHQDTSLEHTRPLKVYNYLKGEAVRMMRNKPALGSKDEVQDLIQDILDSHRSYHLGQTDASPVPGKKVPEDIGTKSVEDMGTQSSSHQIQSPGASTTSKDRDAGLSSLDGQENLQQLKCLHDRPVFYKLYDLVDLPHEDSDDTYLFTQSQKAVS